MWPGKLHQFIHCSTERAFQFIQKLCIYNDAFVEEGCISIPCMSSLTGIIVKFAKKNLFNISRWKWNMPNTVVVSPADISIHINLSSNKLLKFWMCITVLRLLRSLVSKNFDYGVSRKDPISFLWKCMDGCTTINDR